MGLLLACVSNGLLASEKQQLVVQEAEVTTMDFTRTLVDVDASGGAYLSATADGTSLARIALEGADLIEVWVRARGLPLVLKSSDGLEVAKIGAQDTPSWQWASLGQHRAQEVGGLVEVFTPFSDRGGANVPSGLDLVVLAQPGKRVADLGDLIEKVGRQSIVIPDADVVLTSDPAEESEAGVPLEAKVRIDWSQQVGELAERQYSLNIFNGYDPDVAVDLQYQENVAYMSSPVLRYHNMTGMMSDPSENRFGWLDATTQSWDVEEITTALDALEGVASERVMTIGRWPDWMDLDADGMLDAGQYEAFAQLCADLVRLLNIDQKRGIQYFEISNERDMIYWLRPMKMGLPLQIDELAEIHNLCAEAMKQVDPTIKIGGPAACRGDLVQPLKQFAIMTLEHLDFLSYHAYASGDASELDINIYNRTESLGRNLATVRKMLDDLSPDHHIELHLNEYNICYTHKVQDLRMANHKGAVFDALVFIQMVQNGADVANAWNECDNVYGKMGRDYDLRPSAHIFHYFNQWMTGQPVLSLSDQPRAIVPFAVLHGEQQNFVLVNRTSHTNTALVDFEGLDMKEASVEVRVLSEAGLEQSDATLYSLSEGVTMPPHSVAFFSIQ